ncbi:MAG: response regulator [Nautiliaceae bacterium]
MKIEDIKSLASQYSVLVVDDDESILEQMNKLLSNFSFKNIYLSVNGEEAIKILQENHIDIVITDLKMPRMDGIELTEFIKNLNKDISVIIITAYTQTEDLINLIKIGVDGFLVKPIILDNFLEVLSKELIKFHNRDFVKTYSYLNTQKARKEEIKSVIIDLMNFCDIPMFAKDKDEIFFINDKCFEKYESNIKEENFISKPLIKEITIFKERN